MHLTEAEALLAEAVLIPLPLFLCFPRLPPLLLRLEEPLRVEVLLPQGAQRLVVESEGWRR